jgi:ketosteroid isomerase-like protein
VTASANLDLVRSIYAAWERGDFGSAEWAHADIECVIADGPSPGRWTGLVPMAAAWRDFMSVWEEWRVEVEEYRELDSERVLALEYRTARAKISGLEIGQIAGQTRSSGASLFHVRTGKVTKFVTYFDRERAYADLGLAPEEQHDPG